MNPLTAAPSQVAWSFRDGRWLVLLFVPLYVFAFFLSASRGPEGVLAKSWGVAVMRPTFGDLYVIPAAVTTLHHGGDPYVANPYDPLQRKMNYPAIWLRISGTDMSETTIRTTALLMFASALAAYLLFLGPVSRLDAIVVAALLISPAMLLGLQRANIDILMFALLCVGVRLFNCRGRFTVLGGTVAFALAGFLKLYPLAAWSVIVRERGRRFRVALAVASLVSVACLAVNASNLGRLSANTAYGTIQSYGCRVAAKWADMLGGIAGWQIDRHKLEQVGTIAAVFVVVVAAWLVLRRIRPAPLAGTAADGLRAGGSIYVGTFLLGSNFDYRLIFVLLCLPALLALARPSAPLRGWAIAALVTLAGAMWPNGLFALWLAPVKEAADWALLFVLSVLLAATRPAWPARAA